MEDSGIVAGWWGAGRTLRMSSYAVIPVLAGMTEGAAAATPRQPQSTEIPASFINASAYFARVRSMTSAGRFGPGAVLSQSSVSR